MPAERWQSFATPARPAAPAASADDDRSFLSALLAAKGPGIDVRLRLAVLTDLGSSNGTLVNQERINGRKVLLGGEYIQIGDVLIRFLDS